MKIPVRMTNKIYCSLFIKTIATAHDTFTVMCNTIPVNLPVNLNFKFPIGPRITPLKPYNHVECVKEVSLWTKRSTSVKRLHSYHKQGHRESRTKKSIPSLHKKTLLHLSNQKVQKHLDQMMNMAYHRSRAVDRVPLANGSGQTEKSVYKGYLRDLSQENCAD